MEDMLRGNAILREGELSKRATTRFTTTIIATTTNILQQDMLLRHQTSDSFQKHHAIKQEKQLSQSAISFPAESSRGGSRSTCLSSSGYLSIKRVFSKAVIFRGSCC